MWEVRTLTKPTKKENAEIPPVAIGCPLKIKTVFCSKLAGIHAAKVT